MKINKSKQENKHHTLRGQKWCTTWPFLHLRKYCFSVLKLQKY